MPLTLGTRLGPYEILSPLGAGGMGEVYRARDTKLHRDVAIKVLSGAFANDGARLARFRREAQVLASLHHPNIASIYGLEESDGILALALEMVEGEELAERLKRGPIPVDDAIAIAKQIAEGLEAAHEKGIVHRDLKPANIKIAKDGSVKILDFGLAKAYEGEPPSDGDLSQSPTRSPEMTEAGVILGSAAYMSPEQARGKPVDKRADIWSFGVVLFEMLTGKRLFAGETVSDILASVLRQEIPWSALPSETPGSVRRVLHRCLDRDPKERLRDIGEARIALREAPADEPAPPRSFARLLPWVLVAAAFLAAAWTLWMKSGRAVEALRVQELDLAFPADVEPVPAWNDGFAISPDGRIVAMVGAKDGARSVFVRQLDSSETVEMVEASATAAAFSPDSTKVALLSNRVSAVSLVDRERTVVAPNADVTGGLAWGAAGLVFSYRGALWIAPEGGGEPRSLTALDASRHEVLHLGPLFLPGGRTVLFSSFTMEPGTERIEAVSVENGARRVVMERATTPLWSPTGHLIFARDGAFLAIAFDEEGVRVRGEATPALPAGVVRTWLMGGALAARLASNGTLLYMPQEFQAQRLVSVARDGSALTLELPRGSYEYPRLSPDGRRVMVASEGSRLEAFDLDRGTRAPLTTAAPLTSFCVWNTDGSRIVFRRYNVPLWIASDGSDQRGEVNGAQANDFATGAGPDTGSVLIGRFQADTSADVFLLSLNAAFEPRPLVSTRAYEGGAQLSPDNRWLAYASNESGRFEIHVRRFPELDRQWQVSEAGGTQLRWSASGREIYFRSGTHLMAVPFDGTGSGPVMGKPVELFRDEYDLGGGTTAANYDVTPDGRFLMLRREPAGGHLRIVLNWTEELKRILAEAESR